MAMRLLTPIVYRLMGPFTNPHLRVIRAAMFLEWVAFEHSQQNHGVALCG